MKRIPPSRQIAQQIRELLEHGLAEEDGTSLLGTLSHLGLQRMIQEAVEHEVAGFLGREHYRWHTAQ